MRLAYNKTLYELPLGAAAFRSVKKFDVSVTPTNLKTILCHNQIVNNATFLKTALLLLLLLCV